MPQMDGSIRIGTKIETKEAERELKGLESSITKTADKIASLRSKMDALENSKVPTKQYEILQQKLKAANDEVSYLIDKQKQYGDLGFEIIPQEMLNKAKSEVAEIEKQINQLVADGKAFSLGDNAEKYAQMTAQIEQLTDKMQSDQQRAAEIQSALAAEEERIANIKANATRTDEQIIGLLERKKQLTQEIADMERAGVGLGYKEYDLAQQELSAINDQLKEYKANIDNIPERFSKVRNAVAGAFGALNSGVKKANALLDSAFTNIGKSAKKAFGAITDGSRKANASLSEGFKIILKYGFGIRSLYVLFNKIRSGIKEGFANLMNYSSDFANSIQSMKNSMSTLSNQIAAAFAPIVQMVIPWLTKLISVISTAMTYVAQFIAILGGKSTFVKAKQVQDGYNKSLGGTAAAAKKAYGALAKFDDLDVLQKHDEDSDVGGGAAGAVGDLFEEVPVDDWMKDIVDKFKDILSKLFQPLLEAWKREGQFVMDAWKYALNEVWKLIKDIGRDFLIMWQEEATIRIFQDILHIIGDIGLVVGHLARNFREAWNENETGLNILRNIRDIIGIVIEHIRGAADATVEWADKLDFRPLLKAINRFLESMKPLVDAVWGVLEDFYTKVLLPLSKWVLEKGLPDLLQVFIDFNEKVDWASLRQSLAEFWEHLEPFAETVGEGLIIFIERVSDALAGFLNSQEFKDFLKTVEDWMDSVSPQDVADALETVAKGLIALKVALLGFSAISAVTGVLTTIKTFLSFFGVGGGAAEVATTMESTANSANLLSTALGDLAVAVAGMGIFDVAIKNPLIDLAEEMTGNTEKADIMREKYGKLGGTIDIIKDTFSVAKNTLQGYGAVISDTSELSKALEIAMEDISNGAILSDEHMAQLKDRFGATNDDLEMLRQEMLDTNPALRDLADGFPILADASAETLKQISGGMSLIEQGIYDADDAATNFKDSFPILSDEAKAFFEQMANNSLDDFTYAMETGEQVIDGYVDSLNKSSESVQQFSSDVSKAGENMSGGFAAAAGDIISAATEIANTAIESGENIGKGVSEGMMKADFTTAAKSLFDAALTAFNAAAGINSPAKNMEPSGEFLALGIAEGFRNKIDAFTEPIAQLLAFITTKFTEGLQLVKDMWVEAWTTIQESTVEIWTGMQEWFVEYWTLFIELLTETWENILLVFIEKWEEIQLLFNNFIDFLNAVFLVAWVKTWNEAGDQYQVFHDLLAELSEAIKKMLTIFMDNMVLLVNTKWKDAWDNAKNIFVEFEGRVEEIIGELRALIQEFYDWVMSLVSEMIAAIENVGSAIESAGSASAGISGGGRISVHNIVSAPVMDIPHLASGSVIRGGNLFLAMLGDQPHGQTNIEAPLSTIKQAVREELSGMNYGGGLNPTISLNVNGEEFARLTLNDILSEMSRQGYDVEVLGVT